MMRQGGLKALYKRYFGLQFLLPALALHLAIVMIPALNTIRNSLYDWNGITEKTFIGLGNYVEMFTKDRAIWSALLNNIKWMVLFLFVPTTIAFFVASMVITLRRFQMVYRTIIFLPYVLSSAVAGKIWATLYNPHFGVNGLFKQMGWPALAQISWLGDTRIALYAIMFVDNWHYWGFLMVLFVAALHQIDVDLYEVAAIEGASTWQKYRYVTIPGVKPTLMFIVSMSVMWSFLIFDYVWVMTQGGPAQSTEILSTWLYKNAFRFFRAGYGNAIGVLQSALILFVFVAVRLFRRRMEDDG